MFSLSISKNFQDIEGIVGDCIFLKCGKAWQKLVLQEADVVDDPSVELSFSLYLPKPGAI